MTDCFHCGLAVPEGVDFSVAIQGQQEPMCCPGCQAVATSIVEGGLDSFYQYRTTVNEKSEEVNDDFSAYDLPELQTGFVTQVDDNTLQAKLLLEGITCAACAWLIEHHLKNIPGVIKAQVNAAAHLLTVQWNIDPDKNATEQTSVSKLMAACDAIGYRPHPASDDKRRQVWQQENRLALRRLGVAGLGMMQVGMVSIGLHAGAIEGISDFWEQFLRIVSFIIATPVVLYAARPFFSAAFNALKSKHLVMDVPVSLAIGGAYIASTWATFVGGGEVYFDSVSMFTFFLLIGRYLEMRARHRHGESMVTLENLLPLTVRKRGVNGEFETVAYRELQIGGEVQVRPGETLPCDGVIVSGESRIDESALTGESDPLLRGVDSEVTAGTLNLSQPITVNAKAVGDSTRLSAIAQLVARSDDDRPRIVSIADFIASYFVAAVLIFSGLTFAYWWWQQPEHAVWVTLSVLVVTCPCALSLATPAALTAATAALRKRGLVVTRGHVVETLPIISRVVFDKTGTLTVGHPVVTGVDMLADGFDEEELLQIIAALEAPVTHPIARAFSQWQGFYQAENVAVTVGKGVTGTVADVNWRFGQPEFAAPGALLDDEATGGVTTLLLADDQSPIAWVTLQDQAREGAKSSITELQRQQVKVALLSGDRSGPVVSIAEELGISEYQSKLSPEDKLAEVKKWQSQNTRGTERVMMIGDGINDVPVLSAADISIAMGEATDLARVRSDAVLLSSDVQQIPAAIELGRKARNIIRQNLTWALGYNICALPLAAMGMIPPWLAAIGMSLSSLVVVFNALRLK